jgi:hypothetical protein
MLGALSSLLHAMVLEERDNFIVISAGKLPDSGCHCSPTWQMAVLCGSAQFMSVFLGDDVL